MRVHSINYAKMTRRQKSSSLFSAPLFCMIHQIPQHNSTCTTARCIFRESLFLCASASPELGTTLGSRINAKPGSVMVLRAGLYEVLYETATNS